MSVDTSSQGMPAAPADASQAQPADSAQQPTAPAQAGPQPAPAGSAPNTQPQPQTGIQMDANVTPMTAAQKQAVTVATKSPNPIAQHVHDVAETLTGGPQTRYKTNADGSITPYKVPVSTAHLGLALALEVLRGGLTGASGNRYTAGQRGLEEGKQQAAQQRQAQIDSLNAANTQSEAQVRALGITKSNLELHQMALNVGKQDEATNRAMDATYAPVMKDLEENHPDAIQAKVPEWGLNDYLQKHANVTKDMAIPYDTVPVLDPKTGEQAKHADGSPVWGHMYAIVDPSIKTTLSDDTKDMGYKIGEFKDANGNQAQIGNPGNWPLSDIIARHTKYAQISTAETLLNKQIAAMPGHEDAKKLNLADQVRNDPTMRSAVEDYSKYVGVGDFDQTIYTMGQSKDPSEKQSAARLMQFAGVTSDELEQAHNERIAAAKKAQAAPIEPDTDDKARMIANDPTETPARRKLANAVLSEKTQEAKDLKLQELQDTRKVQDSDIDKAAHTLVDDPNNIASIQNIGAMRSDERLRLFNAATDYAKSKGTAFDQSAATRKAKMLDSYENGKQADQIQSYQTFLKHDADLYSALQNFGRPGYTPKWVDKPLNWLEQNAGSDPAIGAYLAKVTPVRDEIQTFLKNNHAPLAQDVDEMSKVVDPSQSPKYLMAVTKSLAQTGQFRLDSVNSRFKHEFKKDFDGLYDDESKAALKTLGMQPLSSTSANPSVPGLVIH